MLLNDKTSVIKKSWLVKKVQVKDIMLCNEKWVHYYQQTTELGAQMKNGQISR